MGTAALPVIAIAAMGGTIAMTPATPDAPVRPDLDAHGLVAATPGLERVAELRVHDICNVPSPSITMAEVLQVLECARSTVAAGASGVVITHGTDTLEETAYLLDLLWDGEAPIVVTGAMRSAAAAGAEGPANLLAAVLTASSPRARGLGVLVCLNDTVHMASRVQKTSSMAVEAFDSPGCGPVGRVVEGRFSPLWGMASPRPPVLPAPTSGPVNVALLEFALADDGRLVRAALDAGFEGIVISGSGVGHVSAAMTAAISEAIEAGVTVVVGSRTGRGGTATGLYDYPGSEVDLVRRGAIMAGELSPRKARLLLHALIAAGYGREAVRARFAAH